MQRLAVRVALVVSLSVFATAARAQEPLDVNRARELFAEGVALIEAERWAEAAERFRRVLRVRSTPQVKFNLALALHGMGELAEAAEILRELTRRSGAPPAIREDARALLDSIAPRVGRLTIRVSRDEDGAVVLLDSEVVGLDRLGYPIDVEPGTHRVVLQRGEETLASREVRLAAGEEREVTLSPVRRASSGTAALPQARLEGGLGLPSENGPRSPAAGEVHEQWWFWTTVGLVGAVLATIVIAVAASP
ncbi:MAG TPA: tetratricopeptide repeat protein [Sandaracinaceae bacterium]